MILSNIKKKGYSVLAFPINREIDDEDYVFIDLMSLIKGSLYKILESSEECSIPEVISTDNEFVQCPGFYIVPNDSSLYNYLHGKWYKVL